MTSRNRWFIAGGWALLGCSASAVNDLGVARDTADAHFRDACPPEAETGSPPEDGSAADGGDASTSADIEAIPCDQLESAWKAFLQQSRTCRSDSDCTVFRVYDDAGGNLTICDRPLGLETSLNVAYLSSGDGGP